MDQERIAIYIDGSNLYFRLRALQIPNLVTFDYAGLSLWVAGSRTVVSKRYYIGVVKAEEMDKHAQTLRREQQRLFAHLESSQQGFKIVRGYLMKYDGIYREKGVDVKLATDLLVGAYENLYDTAAIFSSDTDFIPAISTVRSRGKRIEYIGFAHQPSIGMKRFVSRSRLLTRRELEPFMTLRSLST